jgi:hypothetical protein
MKLDRCLQACTWTRLWAIGHARRLPVPRQPAKAELLDLVRADLARDQALRRELRDLPADALLALHLLALHDGWLPAHDFSRRFGPLRTFKPWRKEAPPDDAPWRAPASTTELLWYRGLIYAGRRAYGHLSLDSDGFCLSAPPGALAHPDPVPPPARPPLAARLPPFRHRPELPGRAFHPPAVRSPFRRRSRRLPVRAPAPTSQIPRAPLAAGRRDPQHGPL